MGILAHELGHVSYYHRLNLLQIANWGLRYLAFPSYRGKHERSTDLVPVWRGLGYQIYRYARYVRYDESTRALYERMKPMVDLFYRTDAEIRKAMMETGIYVENIF